MADQDEQKPLALSEIQKLCGIEEKMDFDAPFATFSWEHWQQIQTCVLLGFARYQRAITNRQPQLATLITLEMLQVVLDMQKEVCSWLESGTHE